MPRPVEAGHRYVAGLDGMRAIAVLAVIAYHLNVGWAKGGLLGVGVFFTLSGYLITDLLLSHWDRHGDLGLGMFWLRRARRLLPALFLMLIVVSIWVALFDASQISQVRREVVSASLYFANWSTIAAHGSYFARFAGAAAARPPVVAVDRGAVLPGVAVAAADPPASGAQPAGAGAAGDGLVRSCRPG